MTLVVWGLSLASGWGGPWPGGLSVVGSWYFFYVAVSCARGASPTLNDGTFSWFFMHFFKHLALALLALFLKKKNKKRSVGHINRNLIVCPQCRHHSNFKSEYNRDYEEPV